MGAYEGKFFKLLVYTYRVACAVGVLNMFLYLPKYTTLSHTSLTGKHLYDVFANERSDAVCIIYAYFLLVILKTFCKNSFFIWYN